ncbi:hypothetical protein [Paraburkholderia unamae]|uniref:Uncharacterized protein n=1 Tax=Paraburkholderia unamae TaxID=219649 RepID=A0ABX5KWX1_9BURK|nr:hypothetical protein [Paraburkholderia unamae]PVX85060.1 hypothetical protein C7402_104303 [Paraburkholderia unamae]CAG9269532.1 conserved hypothetical protein [Paraburkholderia unamae]
MDTLKEAMLILRDDKPFRGRDAEFGKIRLVDKYRQSGIGEEYSFDNSTIPSSDITIRITDDPLDYSEDRSRVAIVPSTFRLYFYAAVRGITPSILRKQLDLADYWIKDDGSRSEGNEMGPVPSPFKTRNYRFRANERADSRFQVDVDVSYVEPPDNAPAGTQPTLWMVDITRAYPYLTPEMRKKKREEEQFKKREKYGYMNLRTGMTCPETGLWEGWTKECGATDILQLEKGQKFDMVRTVPVYKDRSSCPMVEGQWMWLCSLAELSGFSWYGITLKS